ncbi:hypothetical protein [Microbulbifer taiwanensis]|uniref:hypothetical protein n=1 Tax=Microbulbifer taiwanensis TaxID=986746 RepID=UPI0036121BB1
MSFWLAHFSIERNVGRIMFLSVGIFGLATIAFGLSKSFWLSLGVLVVLGAADMVSMVIRGAFVQLETPDEMRGRVSAVNGLFIGASNQLGEFESGLTAHWFGTVPAVVLGGIGTWWSPELRMKLFLAWRNATACTEANAVARRCPDSGVSAITPGALSVLPMEHRTFSAIRKPGIEPGFSHLAA